jgi:broad specificity phosphatase PhoE
MKRKIYLVRHGEKKLEKGDVPLTKTGLEQAEYTGKFLGKLPVVSIFASPLLRTQQTGRIIASHLGLELQTHHLLRERANWGDDPEQSFISFISDWQFGSINRNWKPAVGDSSADAGRRLETVIDELGRQDFESVVLVTHGGVISDFIRNMIEAGIIDSQVIMNRPIDIHECSITEVSIQERRNKLSLEKLGDIKHLPEWLRSK